MILKMWSLKLNHQSVFFKTIVLMYSILGHLMCSCITEQKYSILNHLLTIIKAARHRLREIILSNLFHFDEITINWHQSVHKRLDGFKPTHLVRWHNGFLSPQTELIGPNLFIFTAQKWLINRNVLFINHTPPHTETETQTHTHTHTNLRHQPQTPVQAGRLLYSRTARKWN